MCLGWKKKRQCVEVTQPASCPDITWFWLGLGVVALGAVVGKGKGK